MSNLKVIDLFCGIGGLTYGLIKSGIPVIAGIDSDSTCQYAYEKNNKTKFIDQDIRNITKNTINKFFGKTDIKILVGCAPCQTFSTHSTKIKKIKNLEQDQRWNLLKDFSRIVAETKPDIISMENVPLLQKQKVFRDFVNDLIRLKFHVSYEIIDCSTYGLPQKRRRLVLLASQFGKIKILEPRQNIRKRTVRDAIGTLPKIGAGGADDKDPLHCASGLNKINLQRIRLSKPGGTWRDWPKEFRSPCHRKKSGSTYSSVYARMEWDNPGPTITTQFHRYGTGRFGHPVQHRALSLREGALLQSFPKTYDFIENKNNFSTVQIGVHIGNAVPPKLGEVIGRTIKNHLRQYGRI